jgi:hypothetical protein
LKPAPASGPLSTLVHDAERGRAPDQEVAWYAARLPRDAGTQLDAMCGSGRLLVPLVEAGFGVHGVDKSESRLASSRAKLGAASPDTPLFRQDITVLNLPFRYAAAFVGGGAFQRLADRVAALDALLRVRAHLIEPGILLLDLAIPAHAEHPPGAPVIEVRQTVLDDGSRIACRSETLVDAARRRVRTQRRFERRNGGRIIEREDEIRTMTWYSEDQIATLLGDAGYRDVCIEPSACVGDDARYFAVSARA